MPHLPALLTLGGICSYWRRVAWSTPKLWSTIALYYDSSEPEVGVPFTLVNWWLNQAGKHPLDIWMDIGDIADGLDLSSILELLLRSSKRWREVFIKADHAFFSQLRDHPASSFMNAAASLKVIRMEAFPEMVFGDEINFTAESHKYTIDFGGPVFPTSLTLGLVPITALDIRWIHLQHLDVVVSLQEYSTILRSCPHLTYFRCGVYDVQMRPEEVIVHPSLKLFISNNYIELWTSIVFSFSSFPALQHLTLEHPSPSFVSYILQYRPRWKSLRLIYAHTIGKEEFVRIFYFLDELEELELRQCSPPPNFFRAFAGSPPGSVIKPYADWSMTEAEGTNPRFLSSLRSLEITDATNPSHSKKLFNGCCIAWMLDSYKDPGSEIIRRPLSNIRIAFQETLAEVFTIKPDTLKLVYAFVTQDKENVIRITDRVGRDVVKVASEINNRTLLVRYTAPPA